jgi:inward rectifier potassium channel
MPDPSQFKVLVRRQEHRDRSRLPGAHWLSDLYHLFLVARWRTLFIVVPLAYLILNLGFALLYLAHDGSIANARPHSFWDAFFFSVQTLSTVGYGNLYPNGFYGNCLVAIEAFIGLTTFAMASGLLLSKFSRPTARVIFTHHAVICRRDGKLALMFRMANARRSQIIEANLSVVLARNEVTKEGEPLRRLTDLPLVRSRSPVFAWSWTAVHYIDENSPLRGETAETLAANRSEFILTLIGMEATFSQAVHARHSYLVKDLKWQYRFADIFTMDAEGIAHLDYRNFHQVIPEENSRSFPAPNSP